MIRDLIFDKDEKQCLYVGKADQPDLIRRVAAHFCRHCSDRSKSQPLPFDSYCQAHLTEHQSWTIYLLDPLHCEQIVRKSFFWNQEEYDRLMIHQEGEYQQHIRVNAQRYLSQAENMLIELYKSRENRDGNLKSSRKKG